MRSLQAKDLNHAFEIVSMDPEKAMETSRWYQHQKNRRTFVRYQKMNSQNYTCYYQFDPYREMQLEAEQVPAIKAFSQSIVKWLEEHGTEENRVIQKYGLSFPKIRRFADELGHVCDVAMEHGCGLSGLGD